MIALDKRETSLIRRALLRVVFAVVLSVSVVVTFGLLGTGEVAATETMRADFMKLSLQVDGLRDQRGALERNYKTLVAKIEARKRARGSAALLRDIDLDRMLKEARTLSVELTGLQREIRRVEAMQERVRRTLLASYDERILALEEAIINGDDEIVRTESITQLNVLRQERFAYVGRVRATPDLALDRLPALEDVTPEDPDEAAAQAAEYDDARSQIDARIRSLSDEISKLEKTRRLRRRAQGFKDQESFFDENTTGGRRVARGASSRTNDDADEGGKTEDGAVDAAADPAPLADASEAPAESGVENDLDSAESETPESGGPESARGDDGPTIDGSEVPDLDELPQDPFSNESVVVFEGELESPDGLVEGEGEGGSVKDKLRRLKSRKKALENKSRELEGRSSALKQWADQ